MPIWLHDLSSCKSPEDWWRMDIGARTGGQFLFKGVWMPCRQFDGENVKWLGYPLAVGVETYVLIIRQSLNCCQIFEIESLVKMLWNGKEFRMSSKLPNNLKQKRWLINWFEKNTKLENSDAQLLGNRKKRIPISCDWSSYRPICENSPCDICWTRTKFII